MGHTRNIFCQNPNMRDTTPLLLSTDYPPIERTALSTLQINLGYLYNLSCTNCYVNAGPSRTELMDSLLLRSSWRYCEKKITTLDLTGGAPEVNPHFRYLVSKASKLGVEVIDRCNLTILLEPGYQDLAQFLADHQVTVTASLPCYSEKNVAEQRGKGVFQQSIDALKLLNEIGYGIDTTLPLNLVYNPNGAFLPADQWQLEAEYKSRLSTDYDITFNQLFTITNMPISRFGAALLAKNGYEPYMQLLKDNFLAPNLDTVMCLQTVSVDWQGYIYDCDFNQMLESPMPLPKLESSSVIISDGRRHLGDLLKVDVVGQAIMTADHSYGFTAGQGSSCGGPLD
ncbi:MAG: radical SAM/Cys-rich protein [Porticoccus sp.]|jgi:radical SAM/Cys-rich protein